MAASAAAMASAICDSAASADWYWPYAGVAEPVAGSASPWAGTARARAATSRAAAARVAAEGTGGLAPLWRRLGPGLAAQLMRGGGRRRSHRVRDRPAVVAADPLETAISAAPGPPEAVHGKPARGASLGAHHSQPL